MRCDRDNCRHKSTRFLENGFGCFWLLSFHSLLSYLLCSFTFECTHRSRIDSGTRDRTIGYARHSQDNKHSRGLDREFYGGKDKFVDRERTSDEKTHEETTST